mmetsp:Transcript_22706/g.68371  ORF Transcript_22706/g.68371 Transcript_22706/m.68371 type:complete len:464 (+) Transcript_22706:45-1436(+)
MRGLRVLAAAAVMAVSTAVTLRSVKAAWGVVKRSAPNGHAINSARLMRMLPPTVGQRRLRQATHELGHLERVLQSLEAVQLSKRGPAELLERRETALLHHAVSSSQSPASGSRRLAEVVSNCAKPWVSQVVVWSCSHLGHSNPAENSAEAAFATALSELCRRPELSPSLFTVRLDCAFANNYLRVYDEYGWTDNAILVQVSSHSGSKSSARLTSQGVRNLVESAAEHSNAKVLIFSSDGGRTGGNKSRPTLLDEAGITPDAFPGLVRFHIGADRPTATGVTMGPSLAMVRMMLLARAHATVSLPPYVIVGRRIDMVLERARAQTTEQYPYPVVPMHNMAHDYPTSTIHAAQFLAQLYTAAVNNGVTYDNADWLSMPAFAKRMSKAWCKWDLTVRRVPAATPHIGYLCDVALEYAAVPRTLLDSGERALKWLGTGCNNSAWLVYRGQRYSRREDFQSARPGCVV